MVCFRVALVGASQHSFPGDKATAFQRSAEGMKALAEKWRFDLLVYEKQVITEADAREAREVLEAEKIDFVLLQCTSFAAGLVVSTLARTRGARLGLWAIPEMRRGGIVSYNSLCGIHMYSGIVAHYLKEFNLLTKWYFGEATDSMFLRRLKITISALRAIKRMQHANVALVGGIAPGFNDLYDDERRLLRLFDGIRINRLHEYGELKALAEGLEPGRVQEKMRRLEAEAEPVNEQIAKQLHRAEPAGVSGGMSLLEVNARYGLAYQDFVKRYGYDGVAISCWPKFQEDYLYSVCAVVGELNDHGTVTGCEGDLTSTVSMLLLHYLSEDTTMLMDLSAMDCEDDSVMMWHCGPASRRFCETGNYRYSLNYSGRDHEGADLDHAVGTGIVRDMVFDEGTMTIARLTGESDHMLIASGTMQSGEKESYCGSRGWLGRLELNRKPISALDFFNTIMVRGFQHHFPMVKGDYTEELMETAAWLDLKLVEAVPYENYLQR